MIQFSPLNYPSFQNIRPAKLPNNKPFLHSYPHDTVSFTSTKLLEKDPQEITRIVKETISDESNLMGKGCRGRVYSIPNTTYCVKIPINMDLNDTSNLDTEKWCFNISKSDQVNHVVAKLGDDISIMKKIKGKPCSEESVKRQVSDLPLDSYKNLILQISDADKNGMSFDVHSANVIYDSTNKSLTVIDFKNNSDSKTYYSPFLDTYVCLSLAKNPENNAKLGENLLGLAAREISNGNKDKLPLMDLDLRMLYTNLEFDCGATDNAKKYMNYIESNIRKK